MLFMIIDGVYSRKEKFTLLSIMRARKTPVIWLLNAPTEESLFIPWYNKRNLSYDILKRKFLAKFVDCAICVSEAIKQYATEELQIYNTIVITNGSDPSLFRPQKKVIYFNPKCFKVVWTGGGRYSWQGIDIIIELAKQFKTIDKNILFIIVTDESWVQIPVLENLIVLRSVDYFDLPMILNNADVLLCPYHSQSGRYGFYNSSMKLFDYMAMAKPIIASDMGQIAFIIRDHRNGLLTNNKTEDLIHKILFFKENRRLGNAMGKRAREDVIATYNWDHIVKNIEAVLLNT
jgi:glycosyltransferase involved in cell wall biosynthesis